MLSGSIKPALLAACLGAGLLAAVPAYAGLGGDAEAVRADAAEFVGTLEFADTADYLIEQISIGSGMRIREFLNRDGIVFAVSWSGPAVPELQRLLGVHYPDYVAAVAALDRPGLHRSLRIVTPDLVVEAGGHLRAYQGRAYLPTLIPAGVAAADLH
jgi:hypothetical protein